jgi:hypothetical protein
MKLSPEITFASLTALGLTACAVPGALGPQFAVNRPAPEQGVVFNRVAFPRVPRITNPYLPYAPGTKYVYDGALGKLPEHDVQFVTGETKVIAGVPCVVVLDTGYVDNKLEERTDDYYAQDFYGNVWYFGEYETSYHPRSHKSSWLAGKDGASPGIVMEAAPHAGDTYQQENAPGVAQDMATVLSLTASVHTPFGSFFGNVLETKEFSPLESGVVDHKFYEPGFGLMKDRVVRGAPEELSLSAIVVQRH